MSKFDQRIPHVVILEFFPSFHTKMKGFRDWVLPNISQNEFFESHNTNPYTSFFRCFARWFSRNSFDIILELYWLFFLNNELTNSSRASSKTSTRAQEFFCGCLLLFISNFYRNCVRVEMKQPRQKTSLIRTITLCFARDY